MEDTVVALRAFDALARQAAKPGARHHAIGRLAWHQHREILLPSG
jgi:hypothetical protein